MEINVTINDRAGARVEELIRGGQFNSIEQVVETAIDALAYGHGLAFPEDDEEIDPDAEADALEGISEEDREAIREGLHDIKAGRTLSVEEVRAEMHERFAKLRA